MRRFAAPLAACVILLAGPLGQAQTPEQFAETARFVASHQNPDGGFAAREGAGSTLQATNQAVKALGFVGGSIPDVLGCVEFVKNCRDAQTGGFAPTPGGTPDVSSTAIGLMALAELKLATPEVVQPAVAFLSEHAEGFDDLRIAVAGLEAVDATAPAASEWIKTVQQMRNADGTWGEGPGRAFATGGAAVALLRLGVELDGQEAVLKAIAEGQRDDGGWSEGDGPSTLPASYRVMRAVYMLGGEVDLDSLLSFIARHRKADGGYAPNPDAPADLGSTYYATILIRWARLLRGEPALLETAGFTPLFDGESLAGWEGNTDLWKVRDGAIVGDSPGLDHNEFLATEERFGDFILKFTFRMTGGADANSGAMFRSERIPGTEMRGYQADIGQQYWGCLYDESRRNRVLAQAAPRAVEAIHHGRWNEYVIRALGDNIRLYLNGVQSVSYDEPDPEIPQQGRIAVQVHAGKPMKVEFKDILIQPVPRPAEPASTADSQTPGWHLRTVEAPDGPRKYTVYVPEGYDGNKAVPAVLFLHGAGERGECGIVPAQVGLGPAILRDPASFPAIAVFPQARVTWSAGSADAAGALAALDEVLKDYSVDEDRIVLTGLSMGGRGSWEIGAEQAGRFAAVVPICGVPTEPAGVVEPLKDLPIWTLVGDADRESLVTDIRSLVQALRAAGASPRHTEYRGVGHNSWDRAYNNPDLLKWMLAQRRGGQG